MKKRTFKDFITGFECFYEEYQRAKVAATPVSKKGTIPIKLTDYGLNDESLHFVYQIQRILDREFVYATRNKNKRTCSLEHAFIESFEVSLDLISSLFNGKYFERDFQNAIHLLYSFMNRINKMDSQDAIIYFDIRPKISDLELFIDEINFLVLKHLLQNLFTKKKNDWVYSVCTSGIYQMKELNLQPGYMQHLNTSKYFNARKTWISQLFIIKEKIESELLIENKKTCLAKNWTFQNRTTDNKYYKKQIAIFLPHPKTNSVDDTLSFIQQYLNKKAKDLNKAWIANLLKTRDKLDSGSRTQKGYYPTLAALISSCIKHGIIKTSIRPVDIQRYFEDEYSNKLTRMEEINAAVNGDFNNPKYSLLFNDIGREISKF
ncbi:MAG: hypothetical protein IM584_04615 [Chitinophagaceae bacterium]|jgi:hypothetical protein|nr:hypothetical protein [Chitinophagaceae bacterium]MCA6453633.1 hypothetical protein [Chitinophagaceae bacterium]MCA6455398.1 hypothetical protein [Chitinophagaceae bacterium]MCA6459050.1 hypothetical protein [Chitinophagaceae bacterium]MCA6465580.1 hypothetical protein [Chitinophagaceae bacterium]